MKKKHNKLVDWTINKVITHELGYSYEVWTQRLLAQHIRNHAKALGHECLLQISHSSVARLLAAQELQPHKVRYYLERRDLDFEAKRAEVLCV